MMCCSNRIAFVLQAVPESGFSGVMRLHFILLFSLLTFGKAVAQDVLAPVQETESGNRIIAWINQYPSPEDGKYNTGIFRRIAHWIAGDKPMPALIRPIAVLASNPDSFLVVDQGNRIILDVRKNKGNLLQLFKNNTSSFESLVGICSLPGNRLLFTDSRSNKIYAYEAGRKYFSEWQTSVALQQPTGIAYSTVTDEVWVTETAAHRIAVFNREGNIVRIIGHRGVNDGEFNFPTFIAVDGNGEVYVNDAMNFRIQIFDPGGKFISAFGRAGDATGCFASSKGIAIDSHRNIYVVDALFGTVQIFDRTGNFLYNFGEPGSGKEQFRLPSGIYIDDRDFIYVADSYNARVQIFQLIRKD